METFLTATAIVSFAEIGDKTQLLAILLAARFKKPLPIILGILAATLANHFLAALAGSQVASLVEGDWFRLAIAASFIAISLWALVPDQLDELQDKPARFGAFLTTLIAFFLVEIGDKTQIATIALGAQFHDVIAVTAGTSLGMMLANVPAIFLGGALLRVVPLKTVRIFTAMLFLGIGLWIVVDPGSPSVTTRKGLLMLGD